MRRYCNWGLCPVIGLSWLLATYIPTALEARRSSAWPHCPGKVIESAVLAKAVGEETQYAHIIRYSYDVGGVGREGRRFDSADETHSQRRAEALAARYSAGSRVEVFYDPDRPEMAVLEPGRVAAPYTGVGFTGVMLLLAAYLWWRHSRSAASKAAPPESGCVGPRPPADPSTPIPVRNP